MNAVKNILDFPRSLEIEFNELSKGHEAVSFLKECTFAKNILNGNSFLMGIAQKNPESLFSAIRNIASIGLSLNPAEAHAYLVPRKGAVCLDISYRGMVHLAVECGSIRWVEAKIVYEKDEFLIGSIGEKPTFKHNPFSKDRGEKIGTFSVAKTSDGDFLTETMTIEECYSIRDRSEAYKSFLSRGTACPWTTDENEMIKKTVIKRASKLWPKTERTVRFDTAVELENQVNGIEFDQVKADKEAFEEDYKLRYEQLEEIKVLSAKINEGKNQEEKGLFMLRVLKVKNFNDLLDKTSISLEILIDELKGLCPKEPVKPKKVSDVTFKLEVENESKD